VNWRAVAALVAGIAVALVGTLDVRLRFLFDGSWFSAGIVSFVLYLALMGHKR
jgi:cytosine/uracil/thiamine/allantoin permease